MKKHGLKISATLSGGTFTVWCAGLHSGLLRTLELTTLCIHVSLQTF